MSESPDETQSSPSPDAPDATDADEAYCAACNQSFTIEAQYCPNDGAKLVKLKAKRDSLIGRTLEGRFEIRGALGHGGMGTVYRGWQLSVDREVAVKVIHPKHATDRAVAKRFFREARLASRLSQANIVAVYEFGQDEDILYLVMELLRGRPLSKDLESGRPLPISRIKRIAQQICDGLDAAHSQGIVHRDLKPGNIVLLDDPPGRDNLKILDFGLAKSLLHENTSLVTKTDAILGTPLYMPPEQILGKQSDHTADLYSLGCILFQLAMGRPPYIGDNINVVLGAHVREPIPPFADHVHGQLAEIITRLMDKDPAARIQSARTVHDRISEIADDASTIGSVAAIDRKYLTPRPGSNSGTNLGNARTLSSSPAHSPVTSPSLDRPPRRRWMLPAFALLLAGGIAAILIKVMTNSPSPPDAGTGPASGTAPGGTLPDSERHSIESGPPLEAAADSEVVDAKAVDAKAVDAKVVDAKDNRDAKLDAKPFDAKPFDATPADARRVDAAVPRPDAARPTPDARSVMIDAAVPIAVDAAIPKPVDAAVKPDGKPDIPLLPTNKK